MLPGERWRLVAAGPKESARWECVDGRWVAVSTLDSEQVLVTSSSGQRRSPFASPWVRLASTKPPLRPDAAQPIVFASSRVTRRPGSRSFARIAVHSPV